MCKNYVSCLIILFIFAGIKPLSAQGLLTLEEAVQIGLEQNFGIKLAQNEAEIGHLNRSLGNAGFYPNITAGASRQEIFESEKAVVDGDAADRSDYEISLLAADVALDWTLFDGFRMFAAYRRLGELRDLGETLAKLQMENTITEIVRAYYEIVRQEKLLGVLDNSVGISEERYNIAQTKQELGSGSEYEMLLAQADLNADRAAMLRQEVILNDSRLALIRLLDLNYDAEFDVSDSIEIDQSLSISELYPLFVNNNRQIEAAKQRTSISELEVREIRRERFPEIDLNVGYTYSREETRNKLFLLDRTDGLYVGLTARVNIFNGFNTNRRVQTAQIQHRNEQIRLDEEFKILETVLMSEFKNYTNAIRLVELENENLQLTEEALDIALEQFRLATITSIELRETQLLLIDTENRLIDAQYEAKTSETELLQLVGALIGSINL